MVLCLVCLIAMTVCSARGVSPTADATCSDILPGLTRNTPASSCSALPADSTSGYYWIRPVTDQPAVPLYCDFDRPCGCGRVSSAWTRVALLNMSDPNEKCPDDWKLSKKAPDFIRACTGKELRRTHECHSTFFSTQPLTYSRVCGRVIAYQHGQPDAFNELVSIEYTASINGSYVDGVSITHGSEGSRQHIWTFAGARGDADPDVNEQKVCDCTNENDWPFAERLSFVGNDYFCDSGNHNMTVNNNDKIFYHEDPLWDGAGCSSMSTCCQFNNPPWFCKVLPQPTTDDLEVRICHARGPEDTPVKLVELYVQ